MRIRLTILLVLSLAMALAVIVGIQYHALVNLVDTQRVLKRAALESAAMGIRSDISDLTELSPAELKDLAPGLVDTVLVWTQSGAQNWSSTFRPWQQHIESTMVPAVRRVPGSVNAEQSIVFSRGGIPAVVVPRMAVQDGAVTVTYDLLVLNRTVLRDSILARIVSHHAGGLSEEFVARMRMDDGSTLFASGDVVGPDARVDGRYPLIDAIRRTSTLRDDGQLSVVAERNSQTSEPAGEKEAVLEWIHRSGSLESALDKTLHRQLALLFGLAGIIIAAVVVLLVFQRRAQRLADQQALFVAGISHELKTPVASVLALADNLASGSISEPSDVQEYGVLLTQEGKRLSGMVQDVLDFATASSGSETGFTPLAMERVVAHTLDRVRIRFPEADIQLHVEDDGAAIRCLGQESAISSAVMNLVANAVVHGGTGGPIDVGISRTQTGSGAMCRIEVSDRGPGVSDSLDRLVKPFFRGTAATSRQLPGNGLGLGIVARVVALHDGRLHVANRPGGGASFQIDFPVDA